LDIAGTVTAARAQEVGIIAPVSAPSDDPDVTEKGRGMHHVGRLLVVLGARGPILLVVSLVVGALSPSLARAGYALLPGSAFLLTLGSFLTASLASFETKMRVWRVACVLLWLGLGIPLVAAGILCVIPLDPSLRAGVLLSLLAPPVGSAAAVAGMLGLLPRLALLASIALTLVCPLSIPLLARGLRLGIDIEMNGLAARLFAIIAAAAAVACLARYFRKPLQAVLPDQHAGAGVAVIGLIIVGLATSQGIRTHWAADPALFDRMLATAFAMNIGFCAIGAAVFSWLGLREAATVGLVSGNRNVTLAWAAAGFALPPLAEGYIAACVVPVLAIPLIVKVSLSAPHFLGRLSARLRTAEPP
jgi:predicted Na+-dependent transporter